MSRIKRLLLMLVISLAFVGTANAQYYEIANQIPRLLSPALSGSFNYKGYVEASYLKGLGEERVDFVDVSTTQGFRYANWFFMGIGAGVDVMLPSLDYSRYDSDASIMVPLFADLRFTIGNESKVGVNIDVRVGAAFSFDSFATNMGYLESEESFYLRPSLSLRIPVNSNRPKQAINVGVTYQLLVSDWYGGYYGWDTNKVFNNIGATVGFEW